MKWIKNYLNKYFDSGAHNSLAVRLWTIIAMILGLLAVSFVAAMIMINVNTKKENTIREAETLINGITATIDGNIANYKDISRLIMINEQVMTYMKAEKVDPGLRNDAIYGVMDVLNVCNSIDSVFLFRNDGEFMSTGKGLYYIDHETMELNVWKEDIYAKRGGAIIRMNGNYAVFRRSGDQIVTIARAVYDIYSQKRTGILLMNISTKMLATAVSGIDNADVCIVSEKGTYLAGAEELADYFDRGYSKGEIVHRNNGDKKHHMISGYKPEGLPLIILCRVHPSRSRIPIMIVLVLLLLVVAFAASVIMLASFIAKDINRPIFELSEAMEETKRSGWLKKIDVQMPDNEIGQLADSYNSMNEYLQEVLNRLIDKEKAVQRVEMRVLQEQIKPHFLYNSLETISYMACEAGADNVYSALETLGSFYRNFLSKGDREIPLKREIQIIRDYLSIQKLRYGENINDEYDIDEEALEIMIPKLILQPLVENSIYHGIRVKGEPGLIKISAKLEGKDLFVTVHDTGVGMSEEQIESVLHGADTQDDEQDALSGFGLKGTIRRIRYYCNDEDAIQIFSEEGDYTEIRLKIATKQHGEGE
ncbi:MAG: sensor histidine kinase [Lachnospiraceae bacterium]|nr:sensor histidine kinase [Lachnospiraceae bacterium]